MTARTLYVMRSLRWLAPLAVAACNKTPAPAAQLPAQPRGVEVAVAADAGAPVTAPAPAPPPAPTWPRVTHLEVDLAYACALYDDGRVACWGQRDASGGLVGTPTLVAGLPLLDQLHAGGGFACGRAREDRSLWCWGENHAGQVGTRKVTTNVEPPRQVLDHAGAPYVVDDFLVGESHVCALAGGAVACWGGSVSGECGRNAGHDAKGNWIPVLEPSVVIRGATRLFGGAETSCAVDAKEQLFCWGGQDGGYSGHGDTPKPRRIAGVGRVRAMSFGSGHSCLLDDAGALYCRGWNPGGELGSAGRPQKELDGKGPWHEDFQPAFVRMKDLDKAYTSVSASRDETCVVSAEHDVTCIGTPYWMTSIVRGTRALGVRPSCTEVDVPAPASFPRRPATAAPVGTGSISSFSSSTSGGGPRFTSWTCKPSPELDLGDVVAVAASMGRRCTLHGDGRVRCVGERHNGRARTFDDAPVVVELPR